MAPVVHGLEQIYNQRVDFFYLDIDDPEVDDLRRELIYFGPPTIILLDGEGEIVNTWVGLVTNKGMIEAIDSILLSESVN